MDKEVLVELLDERLSLDAIAQRVGRSPSTVSYWMKRHGLKATGAVKYGPKEPIPLERLATLVEEGLSVPGMADRLGCAPSLVRGRLASHGLKSRQGRNREKARAALERGERVAELECVRHGRTTHLLESRGSYRCGRCRSEHIAEHRRRLKRRLVQEAGGCCRLCGYDRCTSALQFHHVDPRAKEFHLSLRGVTRSLERLRREAEKCVLLCANCHEEVEHNHADLTTS